MQQLHLNSLPSYDCVSTRPVGGTAVQKTLGRAETMVVEIGCVAALSETCKIVTEERTGIAHEPPFSQVFTVKITGETR